MKRKFSTIIGTYALLFSPYVHAAAGWTDYGKVAELVPTSRHYYEFRLSVDKNPSGCDDKTGFYQDYTSAGSDKMYDTILQAVKSDLRVRVYVTGKCNLHGYAEISSVSVVP